MFVSSIGIACNYLQPFISARAGDKIDWDTPAQAQQNNINAIITLVKQMLLERNLMSIYVSVSLRPSDGDVAFASLRPRILSSIPIIFAVHTHTYTRIQYRYCVYWCVLRSSRAFRIFSKFDVSSSLRAQPNSHTHLARQPVLHRECASGCLQQQSCETRALITNSWTLSVRLPLSTPSHGEKLHRARTVKSYRIASHGNNTHTHTSTYTWELRCYLSAWRRISKPRWCCVVVGSSYLPLPPLPSLVIPSCIAPIVNY